MPNPRDIYSSRRGGQVKDPSPHEYRERVSLFLSEQSRPSPLSCQPCRDVWHEALERLTLSLRKLVRPADAASYGQLALYKLARVLGRRSRRSRAALPSLHRPQRIRSGDSIGRTHKRFFCSLARAHSLRARAFEQPLLFSRSDRSFGCLARARR